MLGSALSDLAAVILYFAVEAAVGNVTASLALAGSLPALWTLVAWKRWGQLDPLALASVCLFALAIAISVLTGGSALPLKLTKASLTGIVGLVALISAAVRRPLIGVVVETVSSRRRLPVGSREGQCRQRTYRIATVIVGLTAVVDAAAQFVLASILSTGSFLVVGSIVRWTILFIGGATTVRYLRRGPADSHR